MTRNVLLIEPNYKNKYPPIGLMKLATYHRNLGDKVRFFKGDLNDLIIDHIANLMIDKLNSIDNAIQWRDTKKHLIQYIQKGNISSLDEIIKDSNYYLLLYSWFDYYRKYYKNGEYKKNPPYDRICISTLFTFHWDITVKTIETAKYLVKDINQIFVGGVLATVLRKELEETTKVKVIPGLLNYKGALDNNDIIIDTLPLDYSILFETDYVYPDHNAFFSYATRGCPNRCGFCAVPILEPAFNQYVSIKESIISVKENYGDMPDLLLLDNNVLASPCFPQIIEDIKQCGFEKGAVFTEPDYLDIYIKQLKSGYNDYGFSRAIFTLYSQLLERSKGDDRQKIYDILYDNNLFDIEYAHKEIILSVYPQLKQYYKKYQNTAKRRRIIDFNQGLEADKITDEKAKLLSEICIQPLRIAFDSIKEKDIYNKAIELCHKYGIKSFSNYLLYNYNDKPVELYERLEINVILCENLEISIYSFPMKYHPFNGEFSKNRDFIGEHWNRKYIRAIQIILNATKGKIGRGKTFFYKAFGETIEKFQMLLLMPEVYLLYRLFFESPYSENKSQEWENDYDFLLEKEKSEFIKLITDNHFSEEICKNIENKNIKKLYSHYLITRDDVDNPEKDIGRKKQLYDNELKNKKS